MKTSITSLELHYIVKELSKVVSGRIDKIYHPNKKELIIQAYVTSKGKFMIRLLAGKLIYETKQKIPSGEPDSFCLFLRKQLKSAKINEISQVSTERIVRIEFKLKDEIKVLYVELFGKGNFILCKPDDEIIAVEESQKWKDRNLFKGELYKYPKKEYDYKNITEGKLVELSKESELPIVKLLAAHLGLGGSYAEEVCLISGIDKDNTNTSEKEARKIINTIKDILSRKTDPKIILKDGKIKDVVPFQLDIYKDLEKKDISEYNAGLDESVPVEMTTETTELEKKYANRIDKLKNLIKVQKAQAEKTKKDYKKSIDSAELIYNNYNLVAEILDELKKAKKKFSFEEMKEKLKGHAVVKEITKEGKIKVLLK